ncbi:MAG: pyruvate ferredoxin oxidoreductase [Myxococcota bacterium]
MRKVITGNQAVAYGVMLTRTRVIPAYPITPQTTIIEEIAELQAKGLLDTNYIRVESEHSAMAACIGASMGGVRTFTATSGQGLLLMHEMLHYAAGARLPVVMANVNRGVAPPWSIWSDQTDSLSQRETGWIQLYCEGNQEVLDTTIMAFKIAEAIRLPVMVVLDAFFLSHTSEPVEIPDIEDVDKFLPQYDPGDMWLDPGNPRAFGALGPTTMYTELRWLMQRDFEKAKKLISEVDAEFGDHFGRNYGQFEAIELDDADVVIALSGTAASTGRVALEKMRSEGKKAGILKLKTFRPFPRDEMQTVLRGKKKLAVLDRNFSPGSTGIWAQELRAALYDLPESERPIIYGYVAGLGGRDITIKTIESIYDLTLSAEKPDDADIWIGVKYV